MTDPIITVENLGKRYRIRHQEEGRRYVALRDVIASKLSSPMRWFSRNGPSDNPSVEDFWALKDVSFEVKPGEVVGVIGRNGAGKSTLLKILSRITEPTKGRVVLGGRVASLLEVGTGFHPELTGRENIFLNGAILGMTRSEIIRKFDEIVAFAEVERFLDTPVKRFSSGMYVRLAFAVAAHLQPEILLVDEVLSVGDVEFQKKCLGKMGDVATAGRTVFLVSHNMAVVEALCQRALLIHSGRLTHDGPVDDVLARYHSLSGAVLNIKTPQWRRRRNSPSIIVSAALIDHSGSETDHISLAADFMLDIGINATSCLHSPSVGIGIDDMMGRRLLTLHNPLHGDVLRELEGSRCIRCRVPSFPLAPGAYSVKLAISDRTEEIDAVDEALTFEVRNSDGLLDGRGFLNGLCVARSEWTTWPLPDSPCQSSLSSETISQAWHTSPAREASTHGPR